MSEADQIFYEEIREKKSAASGVYGKKGKKGRVGKMITPADLLGKDYKQSRDLPSFNVYDFLHKINESTALKSVLLSRMDEEYRNYRMATEKTLDAVAEIVKMGIEPLYREIAILKDMLSRLIENEPLNNKDQNQNDISPVLSETSRLNLLKPARKRIKWGNTPEVIRQTVFRELHRLREMGLDISTETIKQHCPSMLRWIYGERAMFQGIDGLRQEFDLYITESQSTSA